MIPTNPDGTITVSAISWETPEYKFALREGLGPEFLPSRSETKATGWDVRCAEPNGVRLYPFDFAAIPLGFRGMPPEGWWYQLNPRSSAFVKKQLHALYGVIDELYENQLVFAARYIPSHSGSLFIEFGERIGQIIPVRRQEMIVTEVSNEEYDRLCAERNGERGTGGFGSTGEK